MYSNTGMYFGIRRQGGRRHMLHVLLLKTHLSSLRCDTLQYVICYLDIAAAWQ